MKNRSQKTVFLVWNKQSIRAYGISNYIGASLHFLYTSRIRHPLLFIKTLQVLRNERPQRIICQSPPITCCVIAMVYKYLFVIRNRPKIIIDAHTSAISGPWSKNVSRTIMKSASGVIVINKEQQDLLIQNYGIRPIVLEDPIPDFTDILSSANKKLRYNMEERGIFNAVVISSFASDEPLQAVLDAAADLPDVNFYITGDKRHIDNSILIRKTDNIIMTGFLEYETYVDLLHKVDVIIDLTTNSKSLIAGAYEAVALEQPLITSNWDSIKRHFNKGTLYTDNSSDQIKKAIMVAMTKKGELSQEMHELKMERIKDWEEKISQYYYFFH